MTDNRPSTTTPTVGIIMLPMTMATMPGTIITSMNLRRTPGR